MKAATPARSPKASSRWSKGDVDGALEMYSQDVTYFGPLTEKRLDGFKALESYFRQFVQTGDQGFEPAG